LYVLVAVGGLLIMAFLSMPVLDGPHSRQYANESSAVSRLRDVTTLQKKFAATHADKGFACVLPLLRPADGEQNSANYDPFGFLTTGASGGYKFMLTSCRTDDEGVVVHYEATAVPIERGRTGFYAFCTDDSGLIWYNVEASPTNCLASRHVLE
jgi:hypothetical protein